MPPKNKPVRVSKNPYGNKCAAQSVTPLVKKVPATQKDLPEDINAQPVRFTFVDADMDGPWSLANISGEDARELLKFLKAIEGQKVGELMSPRSGELFKFYADMSDCPNKEALNRLANLYDSADNVCRLRLTGEKRLYGLRVRNQIALLWWDPHHEIWPSSKK